MSKIFLNGELIWSRNRLPTEEEAFNLLRAYGEINIAAAAALSSGIEVHSGKDIYSVELSSDRRKNETEI